jgi:hypothetical protein
MKYIQRLILFIFVQAKATCFAQDFWNTKCFVRLEMKGGGGMLEKKTLRFMMGIQFCHSRVGTIRIPQIIFTDSSQK